MKLPINSITLDPDLQPRVYLDQATVNRYVESLQRGDTFPAVIIYHDGAVYWLADGFHRVEAAKQAGLTEIVADVRDGSKRDALLFSVSSNEEHGLPRTQADKKKAVLTLLKEPEFSKLSDRELGRLCRVDHSTVAKYRRELSSGDFTTKSDRTRELPIPTEVAQAIEYAPELKETIIDEANKGYDGIDPKTLREISRLTVGMETDTRKAIFDLRAAERIRKDELSILVETIKGTPELTQYALDLKTKGESIDTVKTSLEYVKKLPTAEQKEMIAAVMPVMEIPTNTITIPIEITKEMIEAG